MPTDLTETENFVTPVAVPTDGDPANAASVEVPFQALVNRDRWMIERIGGELGTGEWAYPTTRVKPTVVDIHEAQSISTWSRQTDPTAGYFWESGNPYSVLVLPLTAYLRNLQTIESITVLWKPTAANVTTGDRNKAELFSVDPNFGTPAAPTPASLGSVTDDGTNGFQARVISPAVTIARVSSSAKAYFLVITSANEASGDRLHGVQITIGDPGPRNV